MFLYAALLIAICTWAYWPIFHGGFLLDDDLLVTGNPLLKNADGLPRIWFTSDAADYWPVTSTSFWLEWRLWEANATGYHITNFVLHIVASLLTWRLLRKLAVPGAFLAALLFTVHPLNVESVAWIAQRKNSLAMVLFLCSLLCYLRDEDRETTQRNATDNSRDSSPRRISSNHAAIAGLWYWLSLAVFVLAMLSKGSVAILPLLLLVLAWWRNGRIARRDALHFAPFFLVAAALTLVNLWFQTRGSGEAIRSATVAERIAGVGGVVWFYLSKALLPLDLLFVYPQWRVDTGEWKWWAPLVAAVLLTALLLRRRNRAWGRVLLFAWLAFSIGLLPVLGLVDVGFMKYSLVANHYAHLSLIAVTACSAAACVNWLPRWRTMTRLLKMAVPAATVALLALATRHENSLYANAESLYRHTLQYNPECWMLQNNLATQLLVAGKDQEAIALCRRALELNSDYVAAHNNLGILLSRKGKSAEAIQQYREALRIKPDYLSANNLALALERAGQIDEAIEQFHRATNFKDAPAETFVNLGTALVTAGRFQDAIEPLQQALGMGAQFPALYINLGNALLKTGRPREAIERYREAIALQADSAEAHYNLGCALMETGQADQAATEFRHVVRLNPQLSPAHNNLGRALMQMNEPREASLEFQQALQQKPDLAESWSGLASAYAAMNEIDSAISAAEKGLALARSQKNDALAEQIRKDLGKYRASPK